METRNPPADWALEEALNRVRCTYSVSTIKFLFEGYSMGWEYRALIELARMIEAHEQPPADPLYEALKAVVEMGRYDTREQTELLRHELAENGDAE